MTTMLQDLIRGRLDDRGWPISRLTKVGGIPKSNAYRLVSTPLKRMPEDDTIAGLAKALEMQEAIIRLTAAQDVGIEVHVYEEALADPELRLVMTSMLELPRDARRYFAEMINKYRNDLVHGRAVDLTDGPTIEVDADKVKRAGKRPAVVTMIERRPKQAPAEPDKKVARKRTARRKP